MKIDRQDVVHVLEEALVNVSKPGMWLGYRIARKIDKDPHYALPPGCRCMWVHVAKAIQILPHRKPTGKIQFHDAIGEITTRLLADALPTKPPFRTMDALTRVIWEWNDRSRRRLSEVQAVMRKAIAAAKRLPDTISTR